MSVFTADMLAILWAILWALWWGEDNKPDNSVICSNSAAALTTIREIKSMSRPDTLTEIYQTLASKQANVIYIAPFTDTKCFAIKEIKSNTIKSNK